MENGGCEQICEERNDRFHRCRCRQGFRLAADKRRCHPIDPCAINRGGCEQHCVNDNGRAVCQCYPGLSVGHDQKSCIDIDECTEMRGAGCEHECVNLYGTYRYTSLNIQMNYCSFCCLTVQKIFALVLF
ncbi:unnamed protein product [Gongylonema pulchrum]|uniref:EGF-like domain-containing protein n=1 Tax=Gongylonema pulchrum TaxID=637853 RepID=A0A183D8K6_9BILA|nr:unnamed protein product [Gongylonema pulchrum]